MPEKVFAYVRVSTNLQEEAATQENQEGSIKEYINNHNLTIIDWFYDVETGKFDTRESLNKMIERIDEVDGIVIYDTARLHRDFINSLKQMVYFKERKKKVHLSSENTAMDYDDDMSQLIMLMKSWFDSYERKKIVERSKLGIKRFINKYGRWGPKKKKIDVKMYEKMRKAKISKSDCARFFNMSRKTLYNRLAELNINY